MRIIVAKTICLLVSIVAPVCGMQNNPERKSLEVKRASAKKFFALLKTNNTIDGEATRNSSTLRTLGQNLSDYDNQHKIDQEFSLAELKSGDIVAYTYSIEENKTDAPYYYGKFVSVMTLNYGKKIMINTQGSKHDSFFPEQLAKLPLLKKNSLTVLKGSSSKNNT